MREPRNRAGTVFYTVAFVVFVPPAVIAVGIDFLEGWCFWCWQTFVFVAFVAWLGLAIVYGWFDDT